MAHGVRKLDRSPASGWALFAAVVGASIPAVARGAEPEAVDPEDAQQILLTVDNDLARARDDLAVVALGYGGPTPKTQGGKLERRLREGEIHFTLNDYLRAAIVLLDVVDDEANRSHPRYDDAVYYLAESLRNLQNYSESRRYFEQLLPRARGERLRDVVVALLKIANDTKRFGDVDRYISQLRSGGGLAGPEVDYIHGKTMLLASDQDASALDHAYRAFKSVPPNSSVGPEAAYYAGVALVKRKQLEQSVPEFEEAARRAGPQGPHKAVFDLAQLSLGRVHFELGNIDKAVDAYQEIGRTSPHFSDMLFEVSWAHVKAAKESPDDAKKQERLTRALRMAEILMASAPDSQLFPEARILEGNLQIRLGAPESAYDTFQSIVDGYGGARTQLANLIARNPDPRQFFDQLLAEDVHNIGATELLPPVAVSWAVKTPEMKQAVHVLSDLKTSDQYAKESRELLETLTLAIRGEQRYSLFRGIAKARTKAIAIENRLTVLEVRLNNLERKMVLPYIAPDEQARLEQAQTRRASIEGELQALPTSEEDTERARSGIGEAYRAAEHRVFRLSTEVASMRAQLVAIDVWLGQNRDQLTAEQGETLKKRVMESRAQVAELEKELESLMGRIRTTGAVSGSDAGRAHAEALRKAYTDALGEEALVLRSMRARLPPQLAALPARMDSERQQAQQLREELQRLQQGLDDQIEGKVAEVRDQIEAERGRLSQYEAEYGQLRGETDGMLGPVATQTLNTVAEEFKGLVLKADVGIIDVAWARKQGVTTKISELVQEQQEHTRELELEFSDVLEGN
jgi:tetratricopeptide (TPR) repeat protein